MKRCSYCNSEFVCLNWIHCRTIKRYIKVCIDMKHIISPAGYIKNRWSHECWNCGCVSSTMFKVRFGMDYNTLKKTFVLKPHHILRYYFDNMCMRFEGSLNETDDEYLESIENDIKSFKEILLEARKEFVIKQKARLSKIKGDDYNS